MTTQSRAFIPIARAFPVWDNMPMHDEDAFIAGLRQFFLANPNVKPATVSAEAGLNKAAIRKMLDGQVASPRHKTMSAIATVLGTTVDEIITQSFAPAKQKPRLAVAGKVGAGATVDLIDDHAKGDGLYHIVCPPQVSASGAVAVEIEGDSMTPIYQPGDVLIYSRIALGVPTEAVDRICVAEDQQGRVWVKQVRVGSAPGLFNLLSANPSGSNMHDVRLLWAAPVRLHLPSEFVERA